MTTPAMTTPAMTTTAIDIAATYPGLSVTTSSLTGADEKTSGRWLVRTETSSYDVDLAGRTIVRVPGAGSGVDPSCGGRVEVRALSGDGGRLTLRELLVCTVGEAALMILESEDGLLLTTRATTVVRSITLLADDLDS